jgi:hypothetical protein
MRLDGAIGGKLLLVLGVFASMGGMMGGAQDSSTSYVVLSKNQVLVHVGCVKGCTSVLLTDVQTGNSVHGTSQPLMTEGMQDPSWSLAGFLQGEFQFASKQRYSLVISHGDPVGKTDTVSIDTTPALKLLPGAGKDSVNLFSSVALTLPGSQTPLANSAEGECPASRTHHSAVSLQLPGLAIDLSATTLCEIDMDSLAKADLGNPRTISLIQGIIEKRSSVNGDTSPKSPVQINGLSNVLGAALQIDGSSSLGQSKAPASKDNAWLWINGTITAGTGTAPAWVMDGKLAPFFKQFRGPTILTWLSAIANIGNNKIGGQSAKDVIDFSGASVKRFVDGKTLGEELIFAPTYETNLALNHRNMLAASDVLWDWGRLNQTQLVRTALTHDPSKMPKDGDFKGGYAITGWNLHFHTGFEAGGALAPATVTNSKKVTVGTIPTYSIGRFVPQIDGIFNYRWLGFESYLTGRYLLTTEHTAVNDKAGNPYLETVSGWKAVNVATFSVTPNDQHLAVTIAYTNGFSAPSYQRANGIKIGLLVKY